MKTNNLWTINLLILVFQVLVNRTGGRGNDILGLAIPEPKDPKLDPNTVCKTFPDLTRRQYKLCSRFPDVTASAIQGIQIAIHECQHQFKKHRWNCTVLETKNKNPHSNILMSRGFKETAFGYAIVAAGVMSQVSRACSLGKLKSCGCNPHLDLKSKAGKLTLEQLKKIKEWQWKGCRDSVNFGEQFARKFLNSKDRKSRDLHSQLNLHNNRVGRLAVRKQVETQCKCHGMSGSCELRTCWEAPPRFRTVGEMLKKKYHHATKVDNSNQASGSRLKLRVLKKRRKRKRPKKTELVYYEKSPNFCEHNLSQDSHGTVGRYCNKSSADIDNCETLCCGRGYNTLRVTRTERCNCRFHWCCYVVCQKCSFDEWVTVCK